MARQCSSCHAEIAWLVENRRGLHGFEGRADCAGCHPDHAGVDFDMISWEGGTHTRFDHSRTGWPLEGKHARLACEDCHKPELVTSPAARLGPARGARNGWIGLERACAACHKDPHAGTLGAECTRCHGLEAWKPAARFDHARTSYPLSGAHARVSCDACHRAARLALPVDASGRKVPLYRPLPSAECSACHQDPHAGRLGADCSRCHTVESFRKVSTGRFDHDRTRYPLRGRHREVPCAKCHDPSAPRTLMPRFAACGDCHRDAHAGRAVLQGNPADCAVCHSAEGFRPSTFTVEQHQETRYPLEGRHRLVPCERCHTRKPAGVSAEILGTAAVLLAPGADRCESCHADAHGGQLAARDDGVACAACHGVKGWKPSLYTAAEHARARLTLEGRHAAIACDACHGSERQGLPPPKSPRPPGSAKVVFALGAGACTDCHRDPHAGRFSAGGDRARARGCAECHGAVSFAPADFDAVAHSSSAFPLEATHRAVPCAACHRELGPRPKAGSLLTEPTPGRPATPPPRIELRERHAFCADCHQDPHAGQFTGRADRGACEACHGLESFRPALRFDHLNVPAFPLTGAHARVGCDRCHTAGAGADGRKMVLYRPLPHRCEDCHAKNQVQP